MRPLILLLVLLSVLSLTSGYTTTTRRYNKATSYSYYTVTVPYNINFRLTYGSYGRLEVYHNGQYGTVCDDGFGHREAEVICRHLGYATYSDYGSGKYGSGSGPIWIDELRCSSYYDSIHYCRFNGWGNSDCSHSEDVGLTCQYFNGTKPATARPIQSGSNSRTPIRLVGGNNFYEGRVEVYHSGHWGTICDDSFSFNEADIVCKMLGFHGFSQLYKAPSNYNSAHDKIWLDDVRCYGYESDIANCQSGGWGVNNCGHEEDVWIGCDIYSTTDNPLTMTTEDTSSVFKSDITNYGTVKQELPFRNIRPLFPDGSSLYPYYNRGNGHSTYGYGYSTYGYGRTTHGAYEVGLSYQCSLNNWDVQIYLPSFFNHFPGYVLSDIFLGQDECTGTMDGYYLRFNHELGKCGTTEQVNYNTLEFSNTLTYAIHDPLRQFIIREYKLRLKVTCNIPREETVSKEIIHEQASLPNYWQGFGPSPSTYTLNMQFYNDAGFYNIKYGNPVTARIGEKVYVRVYTDIALDNIKMRLSDCYTKPTPMSSDRFRFYLIRNGCSDDPNTRVVMRTSHETRFVFQDFEYSVNHKSLYIFCEANFCRETDYSSVCNRGCQDNRKRKGPPQIKRNDTDGTAITGKNNTNGADMEVHTATVLMQLNFVQHDVKKRSANNNGHSSGERICPTLLGYVLIMAVGIFVKTLRNAI